MSNVKCLSGGGEKRDAPQNSEVTEFWGASLFFPSATAILITLAHLRAPVRRLEELLKKHRSAILTLLLLGLASLNTVAAQVKPATGKLGIDISGMDRSVRPQDDFFRYVNGAWADRTPIPPDKSRYGSFTILSDESEQALKEILEQASSRRDAPPGSELQKVGDLYRSFIDTERIESLGIKSLQKDLDYIAGLKNTADVVGAIARLSKLGVNT